ncbi:MAG: PqqD family protein [Clostridia bacterium]|nr:PqqD family protein [Clostridia bacterium]
MKIKDGFELVNSSGQQVVVCKNGSERSQNVITLTETAAFLWNLLKEKDVSKTEMLNALIENFEISTVLALGDIDVFVRTMRENEIIEE